MAATSYKPQCVRSVANWTKVSKVHKFESKDFEPEVFLHDLPKNSPKLLELLNKIEELDQDDLKKDGRTYKHFIFSDVKIGGTGAKIVASGLISKGYNLAYTSSLRLKSDEELLKTKKKNFILLASTSVYNKNIGVGLKKQLLHKYNERPSNVYGDLARIIVMDSGFKEGIDLFDVKYVHIFEPQTSKADQKQVIGRATRTCGQNGLVFHPTQGWPLHVFIYDVKIPADLQNDALAHDSLFKVYMESTGIDLRKLIFADELEKVTIVGAVDYELNKNVHRFEIEDDTQYLPLFEGGAPFNMPQPSDKPVSCKARNCGMTRANKNVPVSTPLLNVAALSIGEKIPKVNKGDSIREHYCKLLKTNPKFCEAVQEVNRDPVSFVKSHSSQLISAIRKKAYIGLSPSQRASLLRLVFAIIPRPTILRRMKRQDSQPLSDSPSPDTQYDSDFETESSPRPMSHSPTRSPEEILDEAEKHATPPKELVLSPNNNNGKFLKIRQYVRENFMEFKWPKVQMENHCGYTGPELPLNIETAAKQQGGSRIMNLTPTQGFVSAFFTPKAPIKGMLLQHSVGTGKTCTAIATATKSFEKEGYTILWVTRTSLKSDIWKNAFDQICHEGIKEKVQKGTTIPTQYSDRVRLLSKAWAIRPMSYKQFSNLVAGKNSLYNELVKINGKEDPLRKTLLIIDEAHKLYGGTDLSSIERPDMKKLHAALMKSYQVSKENSVRVMLMTATPVTNDAMEQIKLLNLLRPQSEQLPEEYDDFAIKYLDDNGKFTKKGKFAFLNDIAGNISYLDRSRDARTFSQPRIQFVNVPMSTLTQAEGNKVNDLEDKIKEISNMIADSKVEKKMIKQSIADAKKAVKDRCKNLKKTERTECLEQVQAELEKIVQEGNDKMNMLEAAEQDHKDEKSTLKILISNTKKALKDDSSQLSILNTRCKKGASRVSRKAIGKSMHMDAKRALEHMIPSPVS